MAWSLTCSLPFPGAKHLYLIDLLLENLPDLKSTIEKSYPDVKVTTIQADAADDKAISGVCEQALEDEGRLDVFFANVCRCYIDAGPFHIYSMLF